MGTWKKEKEGKEYEEKVIVVVVVSRVKGLVVVVVVKSAEMDCHCLSTVMQSSTEKKVSTLI